MYEQFYGLSEKPFSVQPDPSFLYWGRSHRLAYAMLEYGVLNHAGISVITGEVGCGKTTLIHRLLDQLTDSHTIALISNIQEGRGDLLSWVLMGFGQPFAGKSHVELFSQLQTFFISEYAKGRRVVLIIDEAQNLSLDMLEELRLLSNINAGKDQLLQLILVGQPQLKGLLNRPELVQLAQRVGADFHLTPLSTDEVQAYIETRLAIAGCRRRIFTDRAVELIAEQSRGVPRVINIIADTALVYAFSAEDLVVGVETIRNVVRDKIDYGVFGIAAEEPTMPPIKPADRSGPEAFFDNPNTKREAEEESPPPVAWPTETPKSNATAARPDKDWPPAADAGASSAEVKTTIRTRIADPKPQTDVAAGADTQEPSAVTGVIVVGRAGKSPEAAIRSASDGRAIVFAPVGRAPDALTIARKSGAVVVDPGDKIFATAGKARNAAYRQLKKIAPHVRYIQFVSAELALDPDWIPSAERFMERRPEVTVLEGRTTAANGELLDNLSAEEVDAEALIIGGASMFIRAADFEAAGGFRGQLPIREIDDLCIRLRRRGGHIWRVESNMALGVRRDKAAERSWQNGVARGYENAFAVSLHGGPPERLGLADTIGAVAWGFAVPAFVVGAALVGAIGAAAFAPLTAAPLVAAIILGIGLGLYSLKFVFSVLARGPLRRQSWGEARHAVLKRFAEFQGAFRFWTGGAPPPLAR